MWPVSLTSLLYLHLTRFLTLPVLGLNVAQHVNVGMQAELLHRADFVDGDSYNRRAQRRAGERLSTPLYESNIRIRIGRV